MHILADQFLYKVHELLPEEVECTFYNPAEGLPKNAPLYDALLIRTVTKIDAETVPKAGNLKFIGTATAGFDHIDLHHLNRLGITFAKSEGCNANAVGEYVITALYWWAQSRNTEVKNLKIGIIGLGNTGSAVHGYLEKLGIRPVCYDPPKAIREPAFNSASLNELLDCDVLTFHTPLTATEHHPTFHMCGERWLKNKFRLILNSARGGVVDENALLKAKLRGNVDDYILDVWENEPSFSDVIAENAFIATPHIAGYSREAKFRASSMVIAQFCTQFNLELPAVSMNEQAPKPAAGMNQSFADFLWKNNQMDLYHRELRLLIGLEGTEKSREFANLRSQTKTRFEYGSLLKQAIDRENLPEKSAIFLD